MLILRRLIFSYVSINHKNIHELHFSVRNVQLHFSARKMQLERVALFFKGLSMSQSIEKILSLNHLRKMQLQLKKKCNWNELHFSSRKVQLHISQSTENFLSLNHLRKVQLQFKKSATGTSCTFLAEKCNCTFLTEKYNSCTFFEVIET